MRHRSTALAAYLTLLLLRQSRCAGVARDAAACRRPAGLLCVSGAPVFLTSVPATRAAFDAASLVLPAALCELNVAYMAASGDGEWPLARAILRIVNNQRSSLSSWQVVWTLVDEERREGDSVAGALLINPGGRACTQRCTHCAQGDSCYSTVA